MICPECHAEGPDGKAYCADCGSPLDPADEKIRTLVQAALRDALKDQRLLPIEIADKAVERFWFYGKIVAIPSALVILALAVWGITGYRDAVARIQAAGQQAVARLQDQASKDAERIGQTTNTVLNKLNQVENRDLPAQVGRVLEQVSRTGKELQNAQAQAAQYREELTRLRTSIVASPPSPTLLTYNPSGILSTLGSPGLPTSTTPGILSKTPELSGSAVGTPGSIAGIVLPVWADRPIGSVTTGHEGEYVKRIQAKLSELGCYKGDVSGRFDDPTSEAVIRFKKAKPLIPSGLYPSSVSAFISVPTLGTTVNGDVDYLTWFDLMESAFPRRCH